MIITRLNPKSDVTVVRHNDGSYSITRRVSDESVFGDFHRDMDLPVTWWYVNKERAVDVCKRLQNLGYIIPDKVFKHLKN